MDGGFAMVPETILEHLGGRRFIAMTGARNFLKSDRTLSFHLPARTAKGGINYCRVRLDPTDTYAVLFGRHSPRDLGLETVSTHEEIYAENLRELFERETGLRTTLGVVR